MSQGSREQPKYFYSTFCAPPPFRALSRLFFLINKPYEWNYFRKEASIVKGEKYKGWNLELSVKIFGRLQTAGLYSICKKCVIIGLGRLQTAGVYIICKKCVIISLERLQTAGVYSICKKCHN